MAHLPLHLLIKIIIDINISLKEILDFLILLLGGKKYMHIFVLASATGQN